MLGQISDILIIYGITTLIVFIVIFIILLIVFFIHRLLGYKTCCGIELKPRDFKYITEKFNQGIEINIFEEISYIENPVEKDKRLKELLELLLLCLKKMKYIEYKNLYQ